MPRLVMNSYLDTDAQQFETLVHNVRDMLYIPDLGDIHKRYPIDTL